MQINDEESRRGAKLSTPTVRRAKIEVIYRRTAKR
jgi:hypothetical protein